MFQESRGHDLFNLVMGKFPDSIMESHRHDILLHAKLLDEYVFHELNASIVVEQNQIGHVVFIDTISPCIVPSAVLCHFRDFCTIY